MRVKGQTKIDRLPIELSDEIILIYYDVPQLVKYTGSDGGIYLSCATHEDNDCVTYIIYNISNENYQLAKDGELEALPLFLSTVGGICYKVVEWHKTEDKDYYLISVDNIPKKYLPLKGLNLKGIIV